MKTILAALALGLTVGAAHAQSVDAGRKSSTVDATTAYYTGGSPGTVGAMNAVVNGVATSPQDVVRQQQGRGTMADGSRTLNVPAVETAGYAPGTVGAAPGANQ